jgi:hypothetical protein
MSTEAQKLAARKNNTRRKLQGDKAISVMLTGDLYRYLEYKRANTLGGFNVSEFVRDSLTKLAETDGYTL